MSTTLPISVHNLSCFMMYVLNEGLSAATISCMLSAVSYFHKLNGRPDPTNSFLIRQLVTAAHKTSIFLDSR